MSWDNLAVILAQAVVALAAVSILMRIASPVGDGPASFGEGCLSAVRSGVQAVGAMLRGSVGPDPAALVLVRTDRSRRGPPGTGRAARVVGRRCPFD